MKKSDEFKNPHAALKHVVITELFSPACFFTESEEEIWEGDNEEEEAGVQALEFLILTLSDQQTLSDHKIEAIAEACVYSIHLILAVAGNDQESAPYDSYYDKEERTLHFYTTDVLPDGCYDILAASLVALSRRYSTFFQETKPMINEDDPYPHFNPTGSAIA